MTLTPALIAMAAASAILVLLNTGCATPDTLEKWTERHVTGPVTEADLPRDPGDVPPEAELFTSAGKKDWQW
jgi:hypothetical protein